MRHNITKTNLSSIGLSHYFLSDDGRLYKDTEPQSEIKSDKNNCFNVKLDSGEYRKISLKSLYRHAYKKEFSIDTIENLQDEEWREIQKTNGKYFASNRGRIKSLCGYVAKILHPTADKDGYLCVKINGRLKRINRLIAFTFGDEQTEEEEKNLEVHHLDLNRVNNEFVNLQALTAEEHRKKHQKRNKK